METNHRNNTADSRKNKTAGGADVETHFSLFSEQWEDLKYKNWFMRYFHITDVYIFLERDGQINKPNISW